ncbi:hypothetical protein ACFL08_03900 [Patescibacteria group bacterium]
MNKVLLSVVALMMVYCPTAFAMETDVSSHLVSQYVAQNGSVFTNHAGEKTALAVAFENGVYAEVWNFTNFQEGNAAREFDYTVGFASSVSNLDMDIGVSYLDVADFLSSRGDSLLLYVTFSKEFNIYETQIVTPSITFEGYVPVEDDGSENRGSDVVVSVEHSFNLGGFSLYHAPGFVIDDGQFGCDAGVVGLWEVGITEKMTEKLSLDASWSNSVPLFGLDDGRKTESVLSVGFAYSL